MDTQVEGHLEHKLPFVQIRKRNLFWTEICKMCPLTPYKEKGEKGVTLGRPSQPWADRGPGGQRACVMVRLEPSLILPWQGATVPGTT